MRIGRWGCRLEAWPILHKGSADCRLNILPIGPNWAYGVLWSIRILCRVQLLRGLIRLFIKFISLASSFMFVVIDKESVS
jgi:hypothetical protein